MLVLALVAAPAAQEPQVSLTLEVRAFNGTEDVTAQSRFTVHRAGERQTSVTPAPIRMGDGQPALQVPSGVYDVQAIHERDGKVVNIRWANRLVVMPYPDEKGHHLEVINFKNGFGALQVRGSRTGRRTGPDGGDLRAGRTAPSRWCRRTAAAATRSSSCPPATTICRCGSAMP